MSFCRSLRTTDCNLLWARCFSFQSQHLSVRQQLFLILNLKLNFKTAMFLHKYLPLLVSLLTLPPSNCCLPLSLSTCLILTVISFGKTKCIELLSTIDYIEHTSHLVLKSLIKGRNLFLYKSESQRRS